MHDTLNLNLKYSKLISLLLNRAIFKHYMQIHRKRQRRNSNQAASSAEINVGININQGITGN